MDRNKKALNGQIANVVALRKESVDRNFASRNSFAHNIMSLSARRAWIEISSVFGGSMFAASLSARRAWIEIPVHPQLRSVNLVALRKESVDRNKAI